MRNDWALFEELCKRPEICNANAYRVAIEGIKSHATIDWMCRKDYADTGVCYCGKLNDLPARIDGKVSE